LKKRKDAPLISFISKREKDILWDSVTAHLTLPVGVDLRNLVKSWALKKIATQFQTWKKLYTGFVKKNLTPYLSENSPYKKLRDD
jgi:RNAse (barnase) inhibitor barstar